MPARRTPARRKPVRRTPKRIPKKRTRETDKATAFDALQRSRPFKSCPRSRSTTFCDVPYEIVTEIAALVDAEKEMHKLAWECPKASLCEILTRILPAKCIRSWRITKFLGEGSVGYVFGCRCKTSSKTGALKIQKIGRNDHPANEIKLHKKFSKLGLSPDMHSHCTLVKNRRTLSLLNMDRIDTTLTQWLQKKRTKKVLNTLVDRIFHILAVMRRKGVTHGDLHSDNIGFVYKRTTTEPGRIQFIDHSYATTKGAITELEIVQFMRTLHRDFSPEIHGESRPYILQRCQDEAARIYGISVSRSLTWLDDRFSTLRGRLRRMS